MTSPSLFPSPDPYRRRRCAKLYNNICIPYTVYLLKSYHCCYLLLSMFQLSLLYSWVSSGKSHDYSHYECIIIGYAYYTLVDRSSPHCSDWFKKIEPLETSGNCYLQLQNCGKTSCFCCLTVKHCKTCAPRQFCSSSLAKKIIMGRLWHGRAPRSSFWEWAAGMRWSLVWSPSCTHPTWGCIMLSLIFLHKIVLEDSHPAFTKGIQVAYLVIIGTIPALRKV